MCCAALFSRVFFQRVAKRDYRIGRHAYAAFKDPPGCDIGAKHGLVGIVIDRNHRAIQCHPGKQST